MQIGIVAKKVGLSVDAIRETTGPVLIWIQPARKRGTV